MSIRKMLQLAVCALLIPGFSSCAPNNKYDATGTVAIAVAVAAMAGILILALRHQDNSSGPCPQCGQPPLLVSDARLKRDVQQVAIFQDGLKLYSFKYYDGDTTYVGLMAQDLLNSGNEKFQHAVSRAPNGYLAVNYAELGFRMMTLDEWKDAKVALCSKVKCTPI
jgi:hypothetical protein